MEPEQLKQDLLARWVRAFDEMGQLEQHKSLICSEKYIPGFRYDVRDFGTSRFLHPEGRIFPEARAREIKDYHFYGLGADGLPCYTSFGGWQGFYSYAEDLVEYVEFCTETAIPSCIKRMYFLDGQAIAYQYLLVQGRASSPVYKEMSREAIIEDISYSLVSRVEKYCRTLNRVTAAEGLQSQPGREPAHFKDVYQYDELGRLEEIRTWWDDGSSQLAYVRLGEGLEVGELAERVVSQLAEAVTDTLAGLQVETPIALLEISYRHQSADMPVIIPRSVAFTTDISRRHPDEDIFDLIFLGTDNAQERLPVRYEKFERAFRQLMQIVEREEKWELAEAVFKKTGHTLTTSRLEGKVATGDEFAAYAVDWEFDMEDFEEILWDCGVDAQLIKAWKGRGWL